MFKSLLLAAAVVFLQSPQQIHNVEDSIVRVSWSGSDAAGEDVSMRCTGFSVGITWVLAAAHCLSPDGNFQMHVNESPARVVKQNGAMILLEVPPQKYPMLQIRKERLKVGDPVTALGFAYGGPIMALRRNIAAYCGCNFADTDHLIMDNPIAKGMSGGPIIDNTGRVVGLSQAGTTEISIGCPGEEILKFINGK